MAGVDLEGAELNGAISRVADLSRSTGLYQEQLDSAVGDGRTRIPAGLVRPKDWPRGTVGEEKAEEDEEANFDRPDCS